jgi:hypothetical protein
MEDGSFFTEKQVVYFAQAHDPVTVQRARFDEIASISLDDKYSWYDQAKVDVVRKDGTSFYLLLIKTMGSHRRFLELLMHKWHEVSGVQRGARARGIHGLATIGNETAFTGRYHQHRV